MVDTKKAFDILGFQPKITLPQGLGDTVTWYSQQQAAQSATGNATS